MKSNINTLAIPFLLFFCFYVGAQTSPSTEPIQEYDGLASSNNVVENTSPNNSISFEEAAKRNGIPQQKLTHLNIGNGYYIISGVFPKRRKAEKAVKKNKSKHYDSGYIHNPKNNLNYVYLARYDDWGNAIEACTTNLGGRYDESVWILDIPFPATLEDNEPAVPIEEVTYALLESQKPSNNELGSNPIIKTKLIKKADYYFDKMWYAEAAKLYEQALGKGEEAYSFSVIQKAGDAHYFNTDMEKAYYWYNILYEKYGKEMTSDNIFKYAHSLKGTGKYARSKRLMRLYNRKMRGASADMADTMNQNALPNEVILDGLMNTKKDFDIHNLAINSKYSEFAPMFHNDGQIVYSSANDTSIFTTRKYKWNNQPYLDLYVAKLNKESQELKEAIKFSKAINTKYHEASVTFSPDNKTMYFTRNNYDKKLKRDKKGVNNLKIYKSKKIDGEWTKATEVPFNSDAYSTGHPALSPDGKKLYFVSDMPGSIGQTDVFVVDVLEGGRFSKPRNLGPGINTERKEMFPFVNSGKLYFSSDGHVGLGGLDVFEATINEDGGFSRARNLGQPINSNKDDFSYIINEDDQTGFFASNRTGGKGADDLYSFKRLKIEEVPENRNAIAGVVTELVTGDLMPETLVTLLDGNNIKLKETVAGENGGFLFEDLEGNTKYTIKVTDRDNIYSEETIAVSTKENEITNTEVALRRLNQMIAIEDGIRKLKTEMIYFDFDSSHIKTDAAKELDKLAQVMKEYPKMVIKIESHTDSRGNRAYNKYLSDKRARSTRDYIISQGIDAERIQSAIGYGEERLINECNGTVRCTEAAHLLNRRSEFVIVDM